MSEKPYKLTDRARDVLKNGAADDGRITYRGTTWTVLHDQLMEELKNSTYKCALCGREVDSDNVCLHLVAGEADGFVCRSCWMLKFNEVVEESLREEGIAT